MNILYLLNVFVFNKCQTCKWYDNNFCNNQKISDIGIYNLAKYNREYEHLCGIYGNHYEPKDPNNELKNIYNENKETFKKISNHNLPRHLKKMKK
jgi:hypothetical protein